MTSRSFIAAVPFMNAPFISIILFFLVNPVHSAPNFDDAIKRECKDRGNDGIVLLENKNSTQPLKVFCIEEIKKLSCQPLSYLRNYILYSHGVCYNTSPNYKKVFSRPGCPEDPVRKAELDSKALAAIPVESLRMYNMLKNIEIQKDCLDEDELLKPR
jgi:hypothetical protein